MMTTGAMADPLEGLSRFKRVLLVFSQAEDPALSKQVALLDATPAGAFEERDLVVLFVPPEGSTRVLRGDTTKALAAAALRRDRDVSTGTGFTALLIGKDGGTKWRESRPARPDEIFALIDSMPMRAREMERNRLAD